MHCTPTRRVFVRMQQRPIPPMLTSAAVHCLSIKLLRSERDIQHFPGITSLRWTIRQSANYLQSIPASVFLVSPTIPLSSRPQSQYGAPPFNTYPTPTPYYSQSQSPPTGSSGASHNHGQSSYYPSSQSSAHPPSWNTPTPPANSQPYSSSHLCLFLQCG
ncbi:hypothetical protein BDR03DRAFT_1019134 [Suillus americanus]|nr:hypothetical protein BDR03DRAFT_1019134 [Suillus americanus]